MVLGRARPRLRSDGSRLFALRHNPSTFDSEHSWLSIRGGVLFEAQADVTGGFPGYVDRGCALHGVQVRVTSNFFLVDEGQPHGFGLPLTAIDGTVLVDLPGRDDYALRVFYRLDGLVRLCTLTFRPGRVGGRGGRRSVRAQEALHQAGLRDRFADNPPLAPEFTLPWDQTREFEHENVIWTGRANAPVRVGAEPAPSEVWLTTKSLIWGSGDGEGINRVPLPLLMDVISTRLRDRIGTPVIYLAIGDDSTGRYELPFIFALHTPPDRNFRERGAFLVGLRSRGLEDGVPAGYSQPWRSGLLELDQTRLEQPVEFEAGFDGGPLHEYDQSYTHEPPHDVQVDLDRPDNISDFTVLLERRRSADRTTSGFGRRLKSQTDEPATPPMVDEFDPALDAESPIFHLDATGIYADTRSPETVVVDDVVPEAGQESPRRVLDIEPEEASGQDLELADPALSAGHRDEPTEPFTVNSRDDETPASQTELHDVVLAEWPGDPEIAISDVAIAETWVTHREASRDPRTHDSAVDDALSGRCADSSTDVTHSDVSETTDSPGVRESGDVTTRLTAVRIYEESAVGALTEVLQAIDDRVAGNGAVALAERSPSSWDQVRALAELAQSAETGEITLGDARHRSERLIALGEVCVRLRTLVELQASGVLATAQLDAKRIDLMNTLSTALTRPRPDGPRSDVT